MYCIVLKMSKMLLNLLNTIFDFLKINKNFSKIRDYLNLIILQKDFKID